MTARTDKSDSHYFSGDITATTAAFPLKAGRYIFAAIATSSWSSQTVTLEMLGPDNSTYMAVPTMSQLVATDAATGQAAITAANASLIVDLPDGMFKIALANTNNVNASVVRINRYQA